VHGLVDPFILVPSLPEMIESVLPLYPDSAESQINDISSGMFNMFLGIGQVAGPLFGSIVSKKLGFRMTCDLVAVICLVFSICYYVFTDGAEAMRKSKWIHVAPEDELLVLNKSCVPMSGYRVPCNQSTTSAGMNRSRVLRSQSGQS
jgi:MFS family permease